MAFENLYAGQTIIWFQPSAPPCYITEGAEKGNGLCDKLQKIVIANLPQYDHQIRISNYKRMLAELENRSNACSSTMLKVKRRTSFLIYSRPAHIALSVVLVMKRKQLVRFQPYVVPDQHIDLKRLLKWEKDIRVGIIKDRSLGSAIEPIVGPYRGTSVISERIAMDTSGLVLMLAADRIDAVIMQPTEFMYKIRELKLGNNDFTFLSILGASEYSVFYMACSRSDEGRRIIDNINRILAENREKSFEFQKEWMNEALSRLYDRVLAEAVPKVFNDSN